MVRRVITLLTVAAMMVVFVGPASAQGVVARISAKMSLGWPNRTGQGSARPRPGALR
jgi:hypothetical protein